MEHINIIDIIKIVRKAPSYREMITFSCYHGCGHGGEPRSS